MPARLDFSVSYRYNSLVEGIEVPVTLRLGSRFVETLPKLDTGATFCVFERRYADMLELGTESGRYQRFQTPAGTFDAFEHEVEMHFLGLEFSALVFFAQDHTFRRSVLGRSGWLNRLRIGLIDHDSLLYLSPYDI